MTTLEKLRAIFNRPETPVAPADPARLAVAALLVEAARADDVYTDREKRLIDIALGDFFSVPSEGAAALRAKAEEAQAEAADLHRFTRVAKALSPADKIRLVQSLWMIVLSDNRRDPHEDAMIRRVCGLIYVSDPESAAARQRAAAVLGGAAGEPA